MKSFTQSMLKNQALLNNIKSNKNPQTFSLLRNQQYSFSQMHFNITKENRAKEQQSIESTKTYSFAHPIWPKEAVENCPITNKPRVTIGDTFAYYFIQSMRCGFDVMSGYTAVFPWQSKEVQKHTWINRVIFLETVAGVPGFVGGMARHLSSLRNMKRDNGWIHTLLEEAENERVHLITFLNIKKPSSLFKAGVIVAQFWYVALFSTMYFTLPRVTHRAVGYLEEEAVKTYTHMIEEIRRDGSPISSWQKDPAPLVAIEYWNLGENATMLDVILAIRKDEEHHKDVNHDLADDYTQSKPNNYGPGQ